MSFKEMWDYFGSTSKVGRWFKSPGDMNNIVLQERGSPQMLLLWKGSRMILLSELLIWFKKESKFKDWRMEKNRKVKRL